jgi:hypothetical protein
MGHALPGRSPSAHRRGGSREAGFRRNAPAQAGPKGPKGGGTTIRRGLFGLLGLPPEQVVGYAKLVVGQKSFDAIAHSEGRSGNVLPFWGEGAVKPVFIETRPLRKAKKGWCDDPASAFGPFGPSSRGGRGHAKLVVGQNSFDAIIRGEGRSGDVLPFRAGSRRTNDLRRRSGATKLRIPRTNSRRFEFLIGTRSLNGSPGARARRAAHPGLDCPGGTR